MRIHVERKPNKFYPDPSRTLLRFFYLGDERAEDIIKKVLELGNGETESYLNMILGKFAMRHRNITRIFNKHYDNIKHLIDKQDLKSRRMHANKKLLLGAYFTKEYSIESAAFFNPSIIEAPNQFGLKEGSKRVIISFRAIGEGHISSIVFRLGSIDRDGNFDFLPTGNRIEEATTIKLHIYDKKEFIKKLKDMNVSKTLYSDVLKELGREFYYRDLNKAVEKTVNKNKLSPEKKFEFEEIMWLADSYYEIQFSLDTDISERVIFPVSETERNGVEDARFVKFTDNGKTIYYAIYTAYDGYTILPKLLETTDFYHFSIKPLHGRSAREKNLALFPRKINGKYAMMSRVDGVNNYVTFSDNINIWEDPIKVQEPKYPWEFIQIGNCGSPIETTKGWLIITHGVGPMRTYCLGASIFDLNDPTKELGRLDEPILVPRPDEMEGYVPNVVYSCGSMICHDKVIIPYGMSDYGSGIITIPLDELLSKTLNA